MLLGTVLITAALVLADGPLYESVESLAAASDPYAALSARSWGPLTRRGRALPSDGSRCARYSLVTHP